jgi:hypothetical protein
MDEIQKGSGWGAINIEKRVCERGDDEYTSDSQKRSSSLFSNQLTTPDTYDDNPPSEVGLHTFGVDGSAAAEVDRETMYFDDLVIVIYEYAEKSGLLPGFQFE